MNIFTSILFPISVSFIAGILVWMYNVKPRLYVNSSKMFFASIHPPEGAAFDEAAHFMHTVTIANLGRTALKKVQVLHFLNINKGNKNLIGLGISPELPHSFEEEGKTIIFPTIAPEERVTLTYIYPAKFCQTVNIHTIHKFSDFGLPMVRSEEAVGKPITFARSYNIPNWLNLFLYLFILVGFWEVTKFLGSLIALANEYALYIN